MRRAAIPTLVVLLLLAAPFAHLRAQSTPTGPYQPTWDSLDARPTPSWYLDAKLGIFIHWGVSQKPDALYAITPGWPGATLTLKDLKASAGTVVTMLGVAAPLKWKQQGANVVIEPPRLTIDELPCKYAYAFKVTGVK